MRASSAVAVEVCMFCGTPIPDAGLGFMTHVDRFPGCRSQHEAWKERLNEDWGGGD